MGQARSMDSMVDITIDAVEHELRRAEFTKALYETIAQWLKSIEHPTIRTRMIKPNREKFLRFMKERYPKLTYYFDLQHSNGEAVVLEVWGSWGEYLILHDRRLSFTFADVGNESYDGSHSFFPTESQFRWLNYLKETSLNPSDPDSKISRLHTAMRVGYRDLRESGYRLYDALEAFNAVLGKMGLDEEMSLTYPEELGKMSESDRGVMLGSKYTVI